MGGLGIFTSRPSCSLYWRGAWEARLEASLRYWISSSTGLAESREAHQTADWYR
jgi:hypothetical protein